MSQDLNDLIKKGESETLILKGPRATQELLARAVCGLLNQQGGTLIWGVNEKGAVSDIKESESKAKALYAYLMKCINPRPFLSVCVEKM